jgi:hypothetical protein
VLDIDPQDVFEVAAADDQQPVETLVADRADEPFRVGVRRWCLQGVWMTLIPSLRNRSSKAAVNLLSRSWIRKRIRSRGPGSERPRAGAVQAVALASSDGERRPVHAPPRSAQTGAGRARRRARAQPQRRRRRAARTTLAAGSARPTRAELDAPLAQLRNALPAGEARADAAEFALQAARARERLFARSCHAFAARAAHPLATCQRCNGALRGTDLLISGRCPNPTCSAPALTALLLPAPRAGLDQHEYLALLGALGALVQLALPDPSDS